MENLKINLSFSLGRIRPKVSLPSLSAPPSPLSLSSLSLGRPNSPPSPSDQSLFPLLRAAQQAQPPVVPYLQRPTAPLSLPARTLARTPL